MNACRHPCHRSTVLACLLITMAAPAAVRAQIPREFKNLKVLPTGIARDSLIGIMRGFSLGTGLRCEGCHVLGENNSFQGARFDLDDKQNKLKARYMLEMVNRLNGEVLPGLPGREGPGLAIECKTCHRGLARPWLLRTELHRVIDEEGTAAAVAHYRALRDTAMVIGAYDFRETELNELAEELARSDKVDAAIAILQLNDEFNPASPTIPAMLGQLFERAGKKEDAIAAYRKAVERNPQDRASQTRLRALTGGED
jgi:tetratricopeptide (TPR) repeat protein